MSNLETKNINTLKGMLKAGLKLDTIHKFAVLIEAIKDIENYISSDQEIKDYLEANSGIKVNEKIVLTDEQVSLETTDFTIEINETDGIKIIRKSDLEYVQVSMDRIFITSSEKDSAGNPLASPVEVIVDGTGISLNSGNDLSVNKNGVMLQGTYSVKETKVAVSALATSGLSSIADLETKINEILTALKAPNHALLS